MVVLLLSLIIIYLRLGIGVSETERNEKFSVHTLFSVYLGWITVATIANVTALLVSISWDRFGISEEIWTVIVLIVATAIVLSVVVTRKDVVYGLVPVWAFIGILTKQFENSLIVASLAGLFAGLILLTVLFIAFRIYRTSTA
jgi:hypothetical protein